MKKVLHILEYCLYFILGNFIFNFIFSITQTIILNILGSDGNFLIAYTESFYNNIVIYIILYFIILLIITIYNINITRKLNEKLSKIKGGNNYEK